MLHSVLTLGGYLSTCALLLWTFLLTTNSTLNFCHKTCSIRAFQLVKSYSQPLHWPDIWCTCKNDWVCAAHLVLHLTLCEYLSHWFKLQQQPHTPFMTQTFAFIELWLFHVKGFLVEWLCGTCRDESCSRLKTVSGTNSFEILQLPHSKKSLHHLHPQTFLFLSLSLSSCHHWQRTWGVFFLLSGLKHPSFLEFNHLNLCLLGWNEELLQCLCSECHPRLLCDGVGVWSPRRLQRWLRVMQINLTYSAGLRFKAHTHSSLYLLSFLRSSAGGLCGGL